MKEEQRKDLYKLIKFRFFFLLFPWWSVEYITLDTDFFFFSGWSKNIANEFFKAKGILFSQQVGEANTVSSPFCCCLDEVVFIL